MRCPCTPGEVARWREMLRTLAPERRDGVIRMLAEAVSDCPSCDEAVRRCDPRRLVGERVMHLRCVSEGRAS